LLRLRPIEEAAKMLGIRPRTLILDLSLPVLLYVLGAAALRVSGLS
jgi:hypothetical protein